MGKTKKCPMCSIYNRGRQKKTTKRKREEVDEVETTDRMCRYVLTFSPSSVPGDTTQFLLLAFPGKIDRRLIYLGTYAFIESRIATGELNPRLWNRVKRILAEYQMSTYSMIEGTENVLLYLSDTWASNSNIAINDAFRDVSQRFPEFFHEEQSVVALMSSPMVGQFDDWSGPSIFGTAAFAVWALFTQHAVCTTQASLSLAVTGGVLWNGSPEIMDDETIIAKVLDIEQSCIEQSRIEPWSCNQSCNWAAVLLVLCSPREVYSERIAALVASRRVRFVYTLDDLYVAFWEHFRWIVAGLGT